MQRLRINREVDDFELTLDDMSTLAALATGQRTGTNPDDRQ